MIYPDLVEYGGVFLFALMVGSFLNVCIARLPQGRSLVKPRSQCLSCEQVIAWYLNIPVLSYVLLRGRCFYCKSSIPSRYLVVECVTPVLFLLALGKGVPFWYWPFYWYFLSALLIASFVDLEHMIIPDAITLPGILVGLAGAVLHPEPFIVDAFLGALGGGGLLLLIGVLYEKWKKVEGIGGGDIKFLAMGGTFLGLQGVMLSLVIGSLVGLVAGLVMMGSSKKGLSTAIPFGPFLAIGMFVSFFWGQEVFNAYFSFVHSQIRL